MVSSLYMLAGSPEYLYIVISSRSQVLEVAMVRVHRLALSQVLNRRGHFEHALKNSSSSGLKRSACVQPKISYVAYTQNGHETRAYTSLGGWLYKSPAPLGAKTTGGTTVYQLKKRCKLVAPFTKKMSSR